MEFENLQIVLTKQNFFRIRPEFSLRSPGVTGVTGVAGVTGVPELPESKLKKHFKHLCFTSILTSKLIFQKNNTYVLLIIHIALSNQETNYLL